MHCSYQMYCMLTYHKLRYTSSSNEILHKVDYRSGSGFNITLFFLFQESDIMAANYDIVTVQCKLVRTIRRSRSCLISVMFEINYAGSL